MVKRVISIPGKAIISGNNPTSEGQSNAIQNAMEKIKIKAIETIEEITGLEALPSPCSSLSLVSFFLFLTPLIAK